MICRKSLLRDQANLFIPRHLCTYIYIYMYREDTQAVASNSRISGYSCLRNACCGILGVESWLWSLGCGIYSGFQTIVSSGYLGVLSGGLLGSVQGQDSTPKIPQQAFHRQLYPEIQLFGATAWVSSLSIYIYVDKCLGMKRFPWSSNNDFLHIIHISWGHPGQLLDELRPVVG